MFKIYDRYDEVPKEIEDLLVFDVSTCALKITCTGAPIGGGLTPDENGVDQPTWTTVCVIRGVGETDAQAVLCCEDCGGWLKDAVMEK